MPEPELSYEELHPAVQRMISRRAFLRRGMQGAAALAVFGGVFAVAGCGGGDSDEAAATTAPPPAETGAAAVPLYDRLGGEDAITAVVATSSVRSQPTSASTRSSRTPTSTGSRPSWSSRSARHPVGRRPTPVGT